MVTADTAVGPPMLWASATRAPSTWLVDSPRSCSNSSTHCAMPVAPGGWPLAFSPPLGFTGSRPPTAVSPDSMSAAPPKRSQNPRSS